MIGALTAGGVSQESHHRGRVLQPVPVLAHLPADSAAGSQPAAAPGGRCGAPQPVPRPGSAVTPQVRAA